MGVSCIVDSIAGKMGLISEQNVTNHTGVRINPTAQIQPATHVRRFNMLNVFDVVRIHSFCMQRSLMRRIRMRAEILLVLVHGLHCTMSIMCSSFSTLRCTWRSAWRFTLGKEPFSCRCWCTRVNTHLSGIRCQGYRSRYSSTAAVVLPLQTLYPKCISAYSS
jgi:hypothetical protein